MTGSAVMRFDDEVAFVTERFDRVLVNGEVIRVHTGDVCQALAVHPERKHQNMGGPGPREILRLLAGGSSQPKEDCGTLFDALAYNYLIGGAHAHAKNHALLHGNRRVRFAPLYDIASAFPCDDVKRPKLAMKIGNHHEFAWVTDRDGDALGGTADLPVAGSVRVRELAGQLLELLPLVVAELREQGLAHELIDRLETGIRRFTATEAA